MGDDATRLRADPGPLQAACRGDSSRLHALPTAASSHRIESQTALGTGPPPAAVADRFTVLKDVPRTFTAAELVDNDSDSDLVNGDTLAVFSAGLATDGGR